MSFLGSRFIFFFIILINKFSKYNHVNVSFCIVEYLDLHLLILSISLLIIVNNFFPFIYINNY